MMNLITRRLAAIRRACIALTSIALAGAHVSCTHVAQLPQAGASGAPALLIGDFEDDYGERHAVSATEWRQLPANRYRIVRWVPAGHYLIAQNDAANRTAGGRWTRMDWVELPNMAPYAWGFCFSAYEAASAAAAESVTVARPETPRTGCNGYPFTRMRRVDAAKRP